MNDFPISLRANKNTQQLPQIAASFCSAVLLPGLRTPYYTTFTSVIVVHSLCHFFYYYGCFTCCLCNVSICLFFLLCLPEGPVARSMKDKTRDCFNLWNMYSQITHFIDKPQRHTSFAKRDVYQRCFELKMFQLRNGLFQPFRSL